MWGIKTGWRPLKNAKQKSTKKTRQNKETKKGKILHFFPLLCAIKGWITPPHQSDNGGLPPVSLQPCPSGTNCLVTRSNSRFSSAPRGPQPLSPTTATVARQPALTKPASGWCCRCSFSFIEAGWGEWPEGRGCQACCPHAMHFRSESFSKSVQGGSVPGALKLVTRRPLS